MHCADSQHVLCPPFLAVTLLPESHENCGCMRLSITVGQGEPAHMHAYTCRRRHAACARVQTHARMRLRARVCMAHGMQHTRNHAARGACTARRCFAHQTATVTTGFDPRSLSCRDGAGASHPARNFLRTADCRQCLSRCLALGRLLLVYHARPHQPLCHPKADICVQSTTCSWAEDSMLLSGVRRSCMFGVYAWSLFQRKSIGTSNVFDYCGWA